MTAAKTVTNLACFEMAGVNTNPTSTKIRNVPFVGCEKHSRLLLGSDSSCRSLQVGTGSHDHQQQHQQTHLLLSRVMLQKLRCLTTLGFYFWIKDKDRLDLDWNLFSTFFKWTHSLLTKTSSDVTGFLSWKDILTLEMLVMWQKLLTPVHPVLFSLEIQSALW